ncbi:hypothetical protein D3C80_1895770 [compost metagenome]
MVAIASKPRKARHSTAAPAIRPEKSPASTSSGFINDAGLRSASLNASTINSTINTICKAISVKFTELSRRTPRIFSALTLAIEPRINT